MKKTLIFLLLTVTMCSGCAGIAENPEKMPDMSRSIATKEHSTQMAFETNVISFEIEPNDGCPRYNAIVEIKNTGDTAIHLGWTPFSVTDSENKLIATENSSAIYAQPSVVYPGESGYYFAARIELPSDIDPNVSYNLVYDIGSIRPVDIETVKDYEVINVSFPEGDYTETIGEIVNGSDTGDYDALCIGYDKAGKIVTIGGTMGELDPNHNTYFEIYNTAAFGKDTIDTYKILARTHCYE